MVAISSYKGNLHKVPDVPRKWLMPARKISLKDFKVLLRRRSRALSRLFSTNSTAIATTSDHPHPNPILNNSTVDDVDSDDEPEIANSEDELPVQEVEKKPDGGDSVEKQEEEKKTEGVDVNPSSEINKKEDIVSDKEKRRQEIQERLQILTEKKHNLVQVLKQIINAEEELKRRYTMQGTAIHPPVALQVDTTHDSGSKSRLHTPRMGSDRNASGDVEGGETNDANHNLLSHHLLHTSIPSPTSQSQQRKSAFSAVVQQPSRTNSGAANGPLRFALTGQQGITSNLPSVSASGTNYITSSPSPVASGGTSAFRDVRTSSPWN